MTGRQWIVLMVDREYGSRYAYGPYAKVEEAHSASTALRQRDDAEDYDLDVLPLNSKA